MTAEKDAKRNLPNGRIGIVVTQHMLLYSSGYVLASTAYLVYTRTVVRGYNRAAIILMFAVCIL
jgi:hypothetical protein